MATLLTEQPESFPLDSSRLWRRGAPRRLVDKWQAADSERRWSIWQKYLARRKRPHQPELAPEGLLWCWADGREREELAAAIAKLTKGSAPDADSIGGARPGDALQAVAVAYAIVDLVASMTGDQWWPLVTALQELAREAQQDAVDVSTDPDDLVRHLLLAGELPLVLGYWLPELAPIEALGKPARRALSETIVGLTDGRGRVHGRVLSAFGPLMAGWTRVRWLDEHMERDCWSRTAENQYAWLVRRAIQLADGERRFLLSANSADGKSRDVSELLSAAIELVGDKADVAAAASAVSRRTVSPRGKVADRDLPKTSFHSEWAAVSLLTSGWAKSAPRLALSYVDDTMVIELRVGERQIFAGNLNIETTCDGRPIATQGAWEESCWQSDEDCDYLELSIDLEGGLELERQILLAKEDNLLYVADHVLVGDRASHDLGHVMSLPIGRDAVWEPEAETRDGVLVTGKRRVAVLPMALGEWRSDPRGGTLTGDRGRLTLTQQATGAALTCPLAFDLKSSRTKKERTWRQLTVAESLEIMPHDVAVGYRAQAGRDQWLFYRSLAPPANRTLVGQNLSGEFFAGRFLATGELDEWIEIEGIE